MLRTALPHGRPRRRRAAALWLLTATLLTMAGLTVSARPAAAHATVVSTTPADGQSLAEAPSAFTVTFTEPVDVELGGLSVLDRNGSRVDDGDTTVTDGGRQLSIPLEGALGDGTYVGTWRVVSADGHPISGSVLFAVGTAVDPGAVSGLSARTDPTWEVVGTVARFVAFVASLLAAGLAFFVAFLHDQRRDRWRLVPVVRFSCVVAFLGILGTIATQAALATGRGVDAVTDGEVLRAVLAETIGWSAIVALIGLALVHLSTNTSRLLVAQGLAFYGGLTVALSFVLWGHATEAPYRWLSVVSDGVHVAAAAIWLGGLVGMAMVLRLRGPALAGAAATSPGADAVHPLPADRAPAGGTAVSTRPEIDATVAVPPRRELLASTATVLERFSTAAMVSVIALLVAGLAMTWIQSGGSISALWSTTYGRLVLVKVLLVAVVLGLAAHNRRTLVPALLAVARPSVEPGRDGADHAAPGTVEADEPGTDGDPVARDGWDRLRRSVVVEVAVLVLALLVTAVLVNVTPARTAAERAATVQAFRAPAGDGTVELSVTPARAGVNTLRIQYLDATGAPLDVASGLRAEFSLPAADLGPLTREVVKVGPGSFVVQGSELSIPGEWQIVLVVRPSDFRELRTPFSVPVR